MAKHFLWFLLASLGSAATAAERSFDFTGVPEHRTPPGFQSAVAGTGLPGDWQIILDQLPLTMAPLSTNAALNMRRPVIAQLAQDPTDEHFPLLMFTGDTYSDFTLSTRFKIVSGTVEQMAGLAFRVQDPKNFYVIRASALGKNVRFYKVVNGERSIPIGLETEVTKDAWHELTVECKGNQIRSRFDGHEVLPTLTDNTFARGKIAFWTKSDSVSYFADARINFVPLELPVQVIIRNLMKEYPHLVGIKVFAPSPEKPAPTLIAGSDGVDIGQAAGKYEKETLAKGTTYFGKEQNKASVVMPLRDRNGEVIAAVRVIMTSFPGQTEQNGIVRATPIVKQMQARVLNAKDLFE